jgi:ADP-heptose:LPS heptosyltransferase
MQLINHCRLFIGLDSGPSHIAASLGKPSLIFFSSVNPAFRHFAENFHGVFLQQPCEFAGCYHEVTGGKGQPCRFVGDAGIPPCTVHTAESVINAIATFLEEYPAANEMDVTGAGAQY